MDWQAGSQKHFNPWGMWLDFLWVRFAWTMSCCVVAKSCRKTFHNMETEIVWKKKSINLQWQQFYEYICCFVTGRSCWQSWSGEGWGCRLELSHAEAFFAASKLSIAQYVRAEERRSPRRVPCWGLGWDETGPLLLSELYFVLNCSCSAAALGPVSTIFKVPESRSGMQHYHSSVKRCSLKLILY